MRILGPDGQPIETGPPISKEIQEFVDQAREAAAAGDPATALQHMAIAFQSDVNSDLVINTSVELLRQMAQLEGNTESEELQLFEQLRDNRQDPAVYYQVGNRFSQLQQSRLARPFLARARELAGDRADQLTQAIDVDYAQVTMDLGSYQEAIDNFHLLNDKYGGLPIWLILEMAECYGLLRQIDEADAVYEIAPPEAAAQFDGMDEVREEVGDLLARIRDFDGLEMGLRAWHYVQTRGILASTNPNDEIPGERFIFYQPTEKDVAFVVGLTAAFLDARTLAPNRLLWLGESSEPLARLFAQWWDIADSDIRPYAAGDNSDEEDDLALLVMAHSHDVFGLQDEETFFDLASAKAGLVTFALDVHWTDRQPMTPDIAGFMSQFCTLPWERRMEFGDDQDSVRVIEETRDAATVAAEIALQFPDEDECDAMAAQLGEAYAVCSDLILDHRDGTLFRRPLVAHSPVQSPRFGL